MAERNTVSVRIALEGGETVKAQLKALGAAFEGIGASAGKLATAFQRFGSASQALNSAVNNVVAQTAKIGFAVTGAVGSVALLAKSSADSAKGIQALADQLGLTTDRVQQLQGAFAKQGVAPDQLTQAFTGVQDAFRNLRNEFADGTGVRPIQTAFQNGTVTVQRFGAAIGQVPAFDSLGRQLAAGVRPAVEAFEQGRVTVLRFGQDYTQTAKTVSSNPLAKLSGLTGANLNSLLGENPERQFLGILDALGKVQDQAERVDIAKSLGIGPDLLAVIKQGTAAITQYADRLRVVFDPKTIADEQQLSAAFTNLTFVVTQTKNAMGAVFAQGGQGTGALQAFTKLIEDNRDGLVDFARTVRDAVLPELGNLILALSGKDVPADSIFAGLKVDVRAAATAIRDAVQGVILPVFRGLLAGAQVVSDGIKAVFGKDISANAILIGAAFLQLTGAFRLIGTTIGLARAGVGILTAAMRLLLATTVGAAVGLGGAFNGAIAAVAGIFGTAAARIVTFAARIAGIIGLADLIISNWTKVKEFFGGLFTGIGDIWRGEFSKGLDQIQTTFITALKGLKNASATTWIEIAAAATLAFRGLPAALAGGIGAGLVGLGQFFRGAVAGALAELRTGIIISEATGVGAGLVTAIGVGVTTAFAAGAAGLIAAIQKYLVQPAEDGVRQAIAEAEKAAGQDGSFLSRLFGQDNANQIFGLLDQIAQSGAWQAIANAATVAWDTIRAGAASLASGLKSIFSDIASALSSAFDSAIDAVSAKLSTLLDKARTLAEKIKGAVSNPGNVPASGDPSGATPQSQEQLFRAKVAPPDTSAFTATVKQAEATLTDLSDRAGAAFRKLTSEALGDLTDLSDRAPQGFVRIGQAVDAISQKFQVFKDGKLFAPDTTAAVGSINAVGTAATNAANAIKAIGSTGKVTADSIKQQFDLVAASLDTTGVDFQALADRFNGAGTPSVGGKQITVQAPAIDPATLDTTPVDAFVQRVRDILNQGIPSAFTDAFSGVADAVSSALSGVTDIVSSVVQTAIDQVSRLVQSIRGAASSAQQASGGGTLPGFASGGHIRGPGHGTSDSILARLSNGEFVIRAAIVQKLGVPLLNAINAGRLDLRALIPTLPKFATGGLVQQPAFAVPRFATGGLVSLPSLPSSNGGAALAPHNLTINLPGGGSLSAQMTPEQFEAANRSWLVRRNVRRT